MTATSPVRPLRRLAAVLVAGALMAAIPAAGTAGATPSGGHGKPTTSAPDLGANVILVTPETPLAEVQDTLDALADQQVDDEMGTGRYAVLFTPGYPLAPNRLLTTAPPTPPVRVFPPLAMARPPLAPTRCTKLRPLLNWYA